MAQKRRRWLGVGAGFGTVYGIVRVVWDALGDIDQARSYFNNRNEIMTFIGNVLFSAWFGPAIAMACLLAYLVLEYGDSPSAPLALEMPFEPVSVSSTSAPDVTGEAPDPVLHPVGGRNAVIELTNKGGYAKFLVRGRILPDSTCNPNTKHKYEIFRQHVKKEDTAIVTLAGYSESGGVWVYGTTGPFESFSAPYQRGLRLFIAIEVHQVTSELIPLTTRTYQIDALIASKQLEITEVTAAEVHDSEKKKPVSSAQWRKLAAEFKELQTYTVRADWQKSDILGEQWSIRGGPSECRDMTVFCRQGGTMLLKSPLVAAQLSDRVKAHNDPVWRWLEYVKEVSGGLSDLGHGVGTNDGVPVETIFWGRIDDLKAKSVRACIDCATTEL